MKRGIANDEFDLSFMGVDEIFDAGVESPARFAGWIVDDCLKLTRDFHLKLTHPCAV